jgi:hypothetical protein
LLVSQINNLQLYFKYFFPIQYRFVTKSVSGSYLATNDGFWEGSESFTFSNAIYEFEFFNLKANSKTYEDKFNSIHDNQLAKIGEIGENNSLVYNLLYWTSYVAKFSMGDGYQQTIGFVGEAADIFNREYMFGSIGSYGAGTCYWDYGVSNVLTYTQELSRVEMLWDAESYNGTCDMIIPKEELGYYDIYDGSRFGVTVDLVTLTSALAVNLGILPTGFLEDVGTSTSYDIDGVNITFQPKYDPRYPRMAPMVCASWRPSSSSSKSYESTSYYGYGSYGYDDYNNDNNYDYYYNPYYYFDDDTPVGTKSFCFLKLGDTYAIPTLNHYFDFCLNCETSKHACDSDYDYGYYYYSSNDDCTRSRICDYFYLLPGLIMYGGDVDDTKKLVSLAMTYEAKDLNDAAQQASKYSAGFISLADDPDMFSFCNEECAMLSFIVYDSYKTVSPYFYDLQAAHCKDTFNIDAWSNLASNPPSDLTEQYYKCYNFKSNAFFSALGIAAGNVGFWVPLVLMCGLLPFIFVYFQITGVTLEKEVFTDSQKDKAAKELAEHLLSIIANKPKGVNQYGVLSQLARELQELAVAGEAGNAGDNNMLQTKKSQISPLEVMNEKP